MHKHWVDECLLLNVTGKNVEARSIMRINLPQVLYKYRPLNEFALSNLANQNLYMCNHLDLNDPYEFHPRVNIEAEFYRTISLPDFQEFITDEEYREIASSNDCFDTFNKIIKKNGKLNVDRPSFEKSYYNGFYNEFKKTKDLFRICSLTEINHSTIMWSHYSDQHRGICIEYPTQEFDLDNPILPIRYEQLLCNWEEFDSTDKKSITLRLFDLLRLKAYDWAYEKEWRILYLKIDNHNRQNPIFISAPKPSAIYVGSRFEENDTDKRLLFDKIVNKVDIPVYQMRLDYNEFRMVPIKN